MRTRETVVVRSPRWDRSEYRATVVLARKPFECSWCPKMVPKGGRYGRTRDWHSSRIADFKVCPDHFLMGRVPS